MTGIVLLTRIIIAIQFVVFALYLIAAFRGTPRSVVMAVFAPWLCCTSTMLAVLDWMQRDFIAAGFDIALAAWWGSDWWRHRPPRPPRRKRVLRAARAGA